MFPFASTTQNHFISPNISHIVLPLIYISVTITDEMKPLLASHILTLTNSLRTWNSSLIVPHNGKLIDISCATQGKKSSVPENAPDQPPCYPNKSKYRFDIKFEGIDALPALRDMLQKCLHGCEVLSKQSGTNRSSNLRVGNWTFACKHSTVNVNFANKIFADGDMKLSHSVTQTLKKKKGEGSTYSGLHINCSLASKTFLYMCYLVLNLEQLFIRDVREIFHCDIWGQPWFVGLCKKCDAPQICYFASNSVKSK